MLVIATFVLSALITTVAQMPPGDPGPMMPGQPPLETGACLDSGRAVPQILQPPSVRAMQVVRIDEVISTATMTPGEIIGFLYTTADGATWLGQRSAEFMSPANATAINQVLSSTHLPSENINEFPPTSRYGVNTKYPRFFRVQIAPGAMHGLHFQIVSCVAWPAARPLPDPLM